MEVTAGQHLRSPPNDRSGIGEQPSDSLALVPQTPGEVLTVDSSDPSEEPGTGALPSPCYGASGSQDGGLDTCEPGDSGSGERPGHRHLFWSCQTETS